ncbi:unnamed protein product [Prorocentrum cordatum]|uniref:Uncharacterized protein n=1 Tax=Prorocentrum cordatum TaxID=2364126 RepID=A0ABN9T567_9DINO|nr:unnamed protein product [Polarella glacialis]
MGEFAVGSRQETPFSIHHRNEVLRAGLGAAGGGGGQASAALLLSALGLRLVSSHGAYLRRSGEVEMPVDAWASYTGTGWRQPRGRLEMEW